MRAKRLILCPNLLKRWQTVLLLKLVNRVTKSLILNFTITYCRVVQIAVHLPPVVQLLVLLAVWVESVSNAACYHDAIIALE